MVMLAILSNSWAQKPFATPVILDNLDTATYSQWLDGKETSMPQKEGPRHVVWTSTTLPDWLGPIYGQSANLGARHLRIGFKSSVIVGSIITKGGGCISVLKPGAAYPGALNDDKQWIPASRLKNGALTRDEALGDDYGIWVLPQITSTRAIRFSHTPRITDKEYGERIGGAYVLSERIANVAPQAVAIAPSNPETSGKLNDEIFNGGGWGAWENGWQTRKSPVSAENPEILTFVWPAPVSLRGLNALTPGFEQVQVQAFIGGTSMKPVDAPDSAWKTVGDYPTVFRYPYQLGINWLDFGKIISTRAVRLKITKVMHETHEHIRGSDKNGMRVWLADLMAITQLTDKQTLASVILPAPKSVVMAPSNPPIPVRFTLEKPGYVTLVIEDVKTGQRVRNLVSETLYPKGKNVAWWDGTDDLGRDYEQARHGIYAIPAHPVKPGAYRVRGLVRDAVNLKYQFSLYTNGTPPWETADSSGGWLTNHTPPQALAYVPADRSPNGQDMVYIGSYVSEGGAGLAWVNMDGRKIGGRGWVGGNWTAAPFLAVDNGPDHVKDVYLYVGAPWSADDEPEGPTRHGELRLTALTASGDRNVLKYKFTPFRDPNTKGDAVWGNQMGGLAVYNGLIAVSLTKLNKILWVDGKAGKVLRETDIIDPRGICFTKNGQLLVLSGKSLVNLTRTATFDTDGATTTETLIDGASNALDDPQGICLDTSENIYISDQGKSHQVKIMAHGTKIVGLEGVVLKTIGKPGAPAAGPYDELHMNTPRGLTVDAKGNLWVSEADYQPKRVSIWTPDGKLLKAMYGPAQYGGGGFLDNADPGKFYFNGMTFKLDWQKGEGKLTDVIWRPEPSGFTMPDGYSCNGSPEYAIHTNGHIYLTNCYNSNPTHGASIATLWVMKNGTAHPVAAMGRANDWSIFKEERFKKQLPTGIDIVGDYWKNQFLFMWSDLNDNGLVDAEETTFQKAGGGGVTVMPDLAFVESRVDDKTTRWVPTRFTAAGAPVYELAKGIVVAAEVNSPVSSGGDQAMVFPNGWTIMTNALKPFDAASVGGSFKGKPMWSYPDPWNGLHASHESAVPEFPGELVGTTRLIGGWVTPKVSDAGPIWALNGNMGNMYLMTYDGLFVATLFKDMRVASTWSMPAAQRGMNVNNLTLHDENFWPSIGQTSDGTIYVNSSLPNIVKVEGLESIRRISPMPLQITSADLKKAESWRIGKELARQKQQGTGTLEIALTNEPPVIDGDLNDWNTASWVQVDKRGTGAYFDSNMKPYDVKASVRISGDRLYAAWKTGDRDLLRNSGETLIAPFKTGGALDLMIGSDPKADPKRSSPAPGDERLLITRIKDKIYAMLYRQNVPGEKKPVPFTSPVRTLLMGMVKNVSTEVVLAQKDGDYEISVPLSLLGVSVQAGQSIKGDIGILRGNGFQTTQRVYWSNKATGITADVPSEVELSPALWGLWKVK